MTTGFASTLTVRGGTLAAQPGSETFGPLALVDGPLGEHPTVTVADGANFAPSDVRLTAGDLVIDDADAGLNSLQQTGGTLRGSGTVGVIALSWSGGAQSGSGSTVIPAIGSDPVLSGTKQLARTLRLERDLAWGASRGTLQVAAGGALENAATLTLADDADIDDGGGVIRNLNALGKPGAGMLDVPDIVNGEGATFTGAGRLTGSVVNSGTLAPGGSPGALAIGGDYTQTDAGTLEIELNGAAFGQFDTLPVDGTATLDGTLAIKRASAFEPGEAEAFTVITAASRVGQFAATTGGELPSGERLAANYAGSSVQIVTAGAQITIGDASASEGDAGTGTLTFPVLLSEAATSDVQLIYRTADGTAEAPGDYAETIGSVTIPAGQTAAAVAVPVNGDAEVEPDETFTVTLVTPAAKRSAGVPVITDERATGMIANDDGGGTPSPTPTPTATASPAADGKPVAECGPEPHPDGHAHAHRRRAEARRRGEAPEHAQVRQPAQLRDPPALPQGREDQVGAGVRQRQAGRRAQGQAAEVARRPARPAQGPLQGEDPGQADRRAHREGHPPVPDLCREERRPSGRSRSRSPGRARARPRTPSSRTPASRASAAAWVSLATTPETVTSRPETDGCAADRSRSRMATLSPAPLSVANSCGAVPSRTSKSVNVTTVEPLVERDPATVADAPPRSRST